MSFNNKIIEKIYLKKTKYKIGILNYVFNNINNYKYDFICILNDLINEDIIKKYQNKNVEIIGYGVRNKQSLKFNNLTYIIDDKIIR